MNTAKNANLKFGLKKIEELNYTQDNNLDSLEISANNINVQYMTQTYINIKENSIKIRTAAKYILHAKDLISMELLLTFIIEDINKIIYLDKDNKSINISVDIVPTLLNVAIGTLRGAMFEKTKDNILKQYPLPLLDNSLIVKNNTFHIEE